MSGAISSGLPLSSIRKSENIVISPLGALVTWQIFPKPSRYCLIGNRWFQANGVWCDEVASPDRMDAQLDDHRRWLWAVIGDLVACTDFDRNPLKTRLKVWHRRANSPDFT